MFCTRCSHGTLQIYQSESWVQTWGGLRPLTYICGPRCTFCNGNYHRSSIEYFFRCHDSVTTCVRCSHKNLLLCSWNWNKGWVQKWVWSYPCVLSTHAVMWWRLLSKLGLACEHVYRWPSWRDPIESQTVVQNIEIKHLTKKYCGFTAWQ